MGEIDDLAASPGGMVPSQHGGSQKLDDFVFFDCGKSPTVFILELASEDLDSGLPSQEYDGTVKR